MAPNCNEVGTPQRFKFWICPEELHIPWEHTFIHSYLLLNKSQKNSMKNNEDFLIPTYPSFTYVWLFVIWNAHIFLTTSGFEKSRGKFVCLFLHNRYLECSCLYPIHFPLVFAPKWECFFITFFFWNLWKCEIKSEASGVIHLTQPSIQKPKAQILKEYLIIVILPNKMKSQNMLHHFSLSYTIHEFGPVFSFLLS